LYIFLFHLLSYILHLFFFFFLEREKGKKKGYEDVVVDNFGFSFQLRKKEKQSYDSKKKGISKRGDIYIYNIYI
jgi:hypothetical protein